MSGGKELMAAQSKDACSAAKSNSTRTQLSPCQFYRPRMDLIMLAVARTLSMLSAAFVVFFTFVMIVVGRFNLLHWGFEGIGFAAGLSFSCAALFALLAIVIAIVLRLRLGASAEVARITLISVICLFVLGIIGVVGSI